MMQNSLKLMFVFFSQKFVMHNVEYISFRTLNKYPPACHVGVMDNSIAI